MKEANLELETLVFANGRKTSSQKLFNLSSLLSQVGGVFIATTTICDDDERDERVDDLERERERERERALSRSGCESEREHFSSFLFFLFPNGFEIWI